MKNQTNTHKLKPEFFNKLVELGVYEKWEKGWKSDSPVSDISVINESNDFRDFIGKSFFWIGTKDGDDFWSAIAGLRHKN